MEDGGEGGMLRTMVVGCKRGDGAAQRPWLRGVSNLRRLCPNHPAVGPQGQRSPLFLSAEDHFKIQNSLGQENSVIVAW